MADEKDSDKNSTFNTAKKKWVTEYAADVPTESTRRNRSGIEIKPIYTPDNWNSDAYMDDLGFPAQEPWARGIYPTMYRGQTWSQRQLIGLATPEEYNVRMRKIVDAGATALSVIPCNSVYRGYDIDEVDPLLLGTCGTTINTTDDMDICLDGVPIEKTSIALNDPSPFTLLAFLLAVANRRSIPWDQVRGTSNQSDFISHFVANHMFFRLALDGARRVFVDHVAFVNKYVPRWNPVSVVGQHMQQGGATPAEAMAFTLSTAVQFAEDCIARGMDPDSFLPRFTFFFDISISFFEEVAKVRAGRRIWARIAKEKFGAKKFQSQRFKFHAQTSGVDLTRQQPLNNISRVTVQAMAGIFGGLQSLHTDGYDEVLSTPTEDSARVAIATQNILRDEAHLVDVIDPLAGSFYVETLTNEMEEKILKIMSKVDEAGGMIEAVRKGLVQKMIGESAMAFQGRLDSSEEILVGVNKYMEEEATTTIAPLRRPSSENIRKQLQRLKHFKADRSQVEVDKALDALGRAAENENDNIFGRIVEAAEVGATNGEICGKLRDEMGFGHPLVAA